MTVSIKAAPATTSNTEGTYTTLFVSGAILLAKLVAGANFNFPIPPIVLSEGEAPPRFYKLTYTVTGSNPTLGTISAGITLSQPTTGVYGNEGSQFPNNFTVAT
jgi:hypothetical protein